MIDSVEEKKNCDALNVEGDRGACAAFAMLQHVRAMGTNFCQIPLKSYGQDFVVSVRPLIGPGMSFGHAIEALKAGKRVARSGWNGNGMWLVLDPGSVVSEVRYGSAYHKAGITGSFTINPHIDMKTATGEMQPGWLASQTDMLADDWVVV